MDKSQRVIYMPCDQWRWTIECEQIIEVHDLAQAIDRTITRRLWWQCDDEGCEEVEIW